jgi:hypothetical protein
MYDKISTGFEDEDAPLGPSELGPPCLPPIAARSYWRYGATIRSS